MVNKKSGLNTETMVIVLLLIAVLVVGIVAFSIIAASKPGAHGSAQLVASKQQAVAPTRNQSASTALAGNQTASSTGSNNETANQSEENQLNDAMVLCASCGGT